MELLAFLRTQARANRLANHRLHAAMRALSREDYDAPRTSFFPSLAKTLEHILAVDLYYLAALHGERGAERIWREAPAGVPLETIAAAQASACGSTSRATKRATCSRSSSCSGVR